MMICTIFGIQHFTAFNPVSTQKSSFNPVPDRLCTYYVVVVAVVKQALFDFLASVDRQI